MKLQKVKEASYHNARTFNALMLNYFKQARNDDKQYYDFKHIWIPQPDTFPWFKEMDIRGPDYSVEEQISFIGQDPKNENDVWVEYEMDKSNGDWMDKDHAMRHIIVYNETGKTVFP